MGCKGGVSKRVYCLNLFKVNYEVPQLLLFKTLVVFAWQKKTRWDIKSWHTSSKSILCISSWMNHGFLCRIGMMNRVLSIWMAWLRVTQIISLLVSWFMPFFRQNLNLVTQAGQKQVYNWAMNPQRKISPRCIFAACVSPFLLLGSGWESTMSTKLGWSGLEIRWTLLKN